MTASRLDDIFAALVRTRPTATHLTHRLCLACVQNLPITTAALTLTAGEGSYVALAASQGEARRLDELQFALGEGPGPDAQPQGGPVLMPDIDTRRALSRWPTYVPAALAVGVRAVFAYPLQVGAIRLGVLTLTHDTPGSMPDADRSAALTYADAATVLLLHLQDTVDSGHALDGLHPELSLPFESTAEVHQATGMISVQAGVPMVEALLLLRSRAYSLDVTPLTIARDVVARRVTFADHTSHDA